MLSSDLDLLFPTDDGVTCQIIWCFTGLLWFYIDYMIGWGGGWKPNDTDSGFAHMMWQSSTTHWIKQTSWIPRKNGFMFGASAPVQRGENALCQTDINHFRKRKTELGIDCNDFVLLGQKHTAWATSAWSCVCKCLAVVRTILLQILDCRAYLVWKSGRCSHLLLAVIAQEGSGKWPLSILSSSRLMFYSFVRCLLLENDLAAQNCTWGK